MKSGLTRVLRVRELLEELAGSDLRNHAAVLRRLEERAEEHRRLAAEARSQTIGGMLDESATDSWLGMADAEIFSWKGKRMGGAALEASEEVAVLRERRMMRRTERQQAEALVSEAAQVEEKERIRREQQQADDWFQSLPASGSRRAK